MSYAIVVCTSQLQVYHMYKLTPLVTCSSIPENSDFADFADSTGDWHEHDNASQPHVQAHF